MVRSFIWAYIVKSLEILLLELGLQISIKTNLPTMGMFGINYRDFRLGSGVIQGHCGPLVFKLISQNALEKNKKKKKNSDTK